MNILITGASGYIGSTLVPELAKAGHTGIAVSRKAIAKLPAGWLGLDRATVLHAPLQFSATIPKAVEAVIHLEVKQHVFNPAPKDLDEYETVNVNGTREWLEWCDRNQVNRFIFFSTIKAVADSEQCRDETAQGEASTPYGASKARAEQLVRHWTKAGEDRSALILRPAVVYGPGNLANIFSLVEAIDRQRFFFVGRNENVKSLVSLRNLVGSVTHLAAFMRPGAEVYNITDRQSYSVHELAVMIARRLDRNLAPRSIPLPVAKAGALFGDAITRLTGKPFPLTRSRLKALLEATHFTCDKLVATGFSHPQTTEEGLDDMINWYRKLRSAKPASKESGLPFQK